MRVCVRVICLSTPFPTLNELTNQPATQNIKFLNFYLHSRTLTHTTQTNDKTMITTLQDPSHTLSHSLTASHPSSSVMHKHQKKISQQMQQMQLATPPVALNAKNKQRQTQSTSHKL